MTCCAASGELWHLNGLATAKSHRPCLWLELLHMLKFNSYAACIDLLGSRRDQNCEEHPPAKPVWMTFFVHLETAVEGSLTVVVVISFARWFGPEAIDMSFTQNWVQWAQWVGAVDLDSECFGFRIWGHYHSYLQMFKRTEEWGIGRPIGQRPQWNCFRMLRQELVDVLKTQTPEGQRPSLVSEKRAAQCSSVQLSAALCEIGFTTVALELLALPLSMSCGIGRYQFQCFGVPLNRQCHAFEDFQGQFCQFMW